MTVHYLPKTSQVHLAGGHVTKRDTDQLIVRDNLTHDDDFIGLYWSKDNPTNLLIEPRFNPSTLMNLVTKNNILAQCINAMEVNIDGTGHNIVSVDEKAKGNEAEKAKIDAFFQEPYPETSFITIRRNLRFDLEATGNAYLEVIKNLQGDIVFLRWVDATMMRLVKLDSPIEIEKEIYRGKEKITSKMMVRERRFCQKVGEQTIFFSEFGSTRKVNRATGYWMDEKPKEDEIAGSEIIHFTLERDHLSSYGVPRWVNQLPSVLGSRKAEEFNLTFFDNGGIPPAIIFLQGGAMTADVAEQLKGFLGGKAENKHRAAIVEVQSASGSLDSAGSVSVKTERFGESRADSMFQQYDANAEEHVRVAFRLPPLFIGRSSDYNFATAMTGYMVAEAQVFQPERLEFDEIINTKLLRAMGIQDCKFESKPITIKNADIQLQALEKFQSLVEPEGLIDEINQLAQLNLTFNAEKAEQEAAQAEAMANMPPPAAPVTEVTAPAEPTSEEPSRNMVGKELKLSSTQVVQLANDWASMMGLDDGEVPEEDHEIIKYQVEKMDLGNRQLFDKILSTKMFVSQKADYAELEELAACCKEEMHNHD